MILECFLEFLLIFLIWMIDFFLLQNNPRINGKTVLFIGD